MLGNKLQQHESDIWLVNTGWIGGPYGTGSRIDIEHTRMMVRAALNGDLKSVPTHPEEHFGLHVPDHVPGLSNDVLHSKRTWPDPSAYDRQAARLAAMFAENFSRNFAGQVSPAIEAAGPH
jgi:phosphoenolpyruvate carboxykinase (ATP)